MKKMYYLLLALIVSQVNFAQEQEPETQPGKGKFSVLLGAGFATLEMEDLVKFNANMYHSSLLYTFNLNDNMGLETGVSVHSLSGDFSMGGYNYFVRNNFVSVPVTFKLRVGEQSKYYAGVGLKPQYMITNDFEAFGDDDDLIREGFEDNKGGSLLGGAVLGGEFSVSPRASVDVGLSLYGDLFQFGYDDDRALKTTEMISIHIGLNVF